jgi:hypothetical protein
MLFLSIDVGIRNLAYIIIEVDENTKETIIIEWKITELCEVSDNACKVNNVVIGKNICDRLEDLMSRYKFYKIIIENQIGVNAIKMKSIQSMLVMYFITKHYDELSIINYNAANKLKHFTGKKKTTYAERKKLSKIIVKQLCNFKFLKWEHFFEKSKKKDDLSDCLLQGLDYLVRFEHIGDEIYKQITIVQ